MPMPDRICWDENGGLYLPPEYAYIGVAMDRRDAADEMQRAFDMAGRARRGEPMYPWESAPTTTHTTGRHLAEIRGCRGDERN